MDILEFGTYFSGIILSWGIFIALFPATKRTAIAPARSSKSVRDRFGIEAQGGNDNE